MTSSSTSSSQYSPGISPTPSSPLNPLLVRYLKGEIRKRVKKEVATQATRLKDKLQAQNIQILGIFITLFTFVSIEFSIAKNAGLTLKELLQFTVILASVQLVFISALISLVKNLKKVNFWLSLLTVLVILAIVSALF